MADYTKLLDHYLYDLSEDVDLIAEAITTLENLFDHRDRQELMYFSRPTAVSYLALKKAQKLLKEQQPRILTYEEMKTLGQNCDAVYIEQSPENSYRKCFWGLACPGVEPPKDEPYNYPGGVDFNAVDVEGDMQDGDFYQLNTPLGWRAWSGKPTEEQMKAVSWSVT